MTDLFVTWNVDPVLIHWGVNGGIRWYGLCWALGIYLAYLIQVKLYRNEHCPQDWPEKIFMWMTLGVIIGARIGHCWFYEWYYHEDALQIFSWNIHYRNPYIEHPLDLVKIWEGGLSSHGGAFGLIFAAWLLNKRHFSKYRLQNGEWSQTAKSGAQTSLVWIFDRLVIGVCITATLIRFGNLMNSEIYGGETSLPWGFIFVRDGQTTPHHPTQIYEMLYCIVAFVVTWLMYWKGQCYKKEGLIFGVFLEIVFVTRFVLEFIKLDQEAFEANMALNMGQWLSLPFIVWGVWLIVRALTKKEV